MISIDQIQYLIGGGGRIVDPDGDKLGNLVHVFLDDQSGKPEWVSVTTGMFSAAASLVPLVEATLSGDQITVPYDKDKVRAAPKVEDFENHLSRDQEAELYAYWGIDDAPAQSEPGLPSRDPKPSPGTRTAASPTSWEGLPANNAQISTDKARLRKYVATDSLPETDSLRH